MANASSPLDSDVLLDALLTNSPDGVYFKDRYCRFVRLNQKMAGAFGFQDVTALLGKSESDLLGEEVGRRAMMEDLYVMESGQPRVDIIESRLGADGVPHWVSISKFPVRDRQGQVIGLLGIVREADAVKRMEADVHFLATHDALTELPNRALLTDRIEQCIARALRQQVAFAVVYLDVRGLRQVNDHHGYDAGDEVLREAGRRIRAAVRRSDTVARLGGDEFVVLLEGVQNAVNARRVAEKIRQSVEQPVTWNDHTMQIGLSIGISLFPQHAAEATALLQAAERAMYLARRRKSHIAVAGT